MKPASREALRGESEATTARSVRLQEKIALLRRQMRALRAMEEEVAASHNENLGTRSAAHQS